jgi:ABC-type phosphate transport system substrate-binding protein
MRLIRKLLAVCGALALIAVSAVPALADPPKGVTPRPSDVVGVGSDTLGFLLDQFSHDYNAVHEGGSSLLYSFDPINPVTGKTGDPIVTKAGCKPIARPDGSSAGIAALEANTRVPGHAKDFCIDFAGSSRAQTKTDPACETGGICFAPVAGDAVTWATRDAASGGTDAPPNLTTAQLVSIYECTDTNWDEVGGKKGPIEPFLPQTSSGTRVFWLTALGGGKTPITPGPCVSDDDNTLQDNEGINPVLNSAGVIVPYSVADYLAQVYHDAPCTNPACTGNPPCKPKGSQNMFGCDEHGVLGLGEINGSKPVTIWPPPSPPCAKCHINRRFLPLFLRPVYAVVRFAKKGTHIPANLQPIFNPAKAPKHSGTRQAYTPGYVCTDATALQDDSDYGFVTLPIDPGGVECGECAVGHWITSERPRPQAVALRRAAKLER